MTPCSVHPLRVALLAILTSAGCHPRQDLPASLQALLDSTVAATPSIPGLILKVEAPRLNLDWSGAAGVADRASRERLTVRHTFRLASNTKTYVAAAVLRLVEEGTIGLGDPIARHLAPATVEQLERGGYDPAAITVRDLLQHVGGIYDYATDPAFPDAVFGQPDRRWTRAEQVEFAIANGKPYGKPGEAYHYSDTGYILLGELLERTTGMSLGGAVGSLVGFERLGLAATWFESLDPVPAAAGPRAHQYADTIDITAFDPSFDLHGGGGLVANVADLSGFYRALLDGRVFRQPATLDSMRVVAPQSTGDDPSRGYAMGIGRRVIGGWTCWGHGGYWGTMAVSCPEAGLTIAVTMNRSPDDRFDPSAVINQVVALVHPLLSSGAP
jgi:D-alanyl-D-alanine carboxypeptidase